MQPQAEVSISAHIESNEIKSCLLKSLRLTIDVTLSWCKHIINILKKNFLGISALKRVRPNNHLRILGSKNKYDLT